MTKDIQMHLFLDADEKETIEKRMQETGIRNLSAYIRKMAMNGYIINLEIPELREILRLLRINSNNLNQYAKKANQTGSIYRRDIEDLQKDQKTLLELMGKVLDRLYAMEGEGG